MQLDSTLEMSLEESTDTLPHTGLDQTADQSDLPDRNGLRIVRREAQIQNSESVYVGSVSFRH